MGKVIILDETTKYPITKMGKRAGICQGSDITDDEKNYKRGLECLESIHGRTWEFPDVELYIEGYSARVIREYYTHIGCLPTRLQSSTRYINYENLEVIKPYTINTSDKNKVWNTCINTIKECYKKLEELKVPREDVAMLLPLGMSTNIVDKRNMRNLIDMAQNRMCNRAYHEFRKLFKDICKALSEYSDEWKYIVDNYFKSKCEILGYCPEKKSCGKVKSKN